MPDYGIEFRDLGRCVEFIELALRNRRSLGIERENIDRIFVTDKRYTVFLTDAQEQIDLLLRKLIKAKTIQQIQDGEPPGEELTINRLLERVRLVARPQPQIDAGVAVVLHDAADKDFRSRYSEILSMGCRDLRVGIVQPTDEKLPDHAHHSRGSPAQTVFHPRLLDSKHQRMGVSGRRVLPVLRQRGLSALCRNGV